MMELISKICCVILFTILVVLVSAAVIFAILMIEIKVLLRRRKRLKEALSSDEARLIELSALASKLTDSVNSYISELMRKKQELQDRKCNCSHSPTNNIENQTSSQ